MKKAFDVWRDSSIESNESECPVGVSMQAVKDDENVFDGMFTFMAKSDDEDDEEKVTLLDHKQKLSVLNDKRLRNLAAVLIDSIIELKLKMI